MIVVSKPKDLVDCFKTSERQSILLKAIQIANDEDGQEVDPTNYPNFLLRNLRVFEIINLSNEPAEMGFVKFILEKSEMLQILKITVSVEDEKPQILYFLSYFSHASKQVKITFE
ncbi:hypothetical protein R6Q59_024407 [Mikania micrantha]